MESVDKVVNVNQVQPVEPDYMRIGIKENAMQFEFGQSKDSNEIEIVSVVRLNPKYLQQFMVKIVEAGIEYEKKFGTEIGFSTFWKLENK